MQKHELITRILLCGRIPKVTDDLITRSVEGAIMESIVAGRNDLSEDCQITTMHGRELPDQDNKAAVEAFVWSMLDRVGLRGLEYRTEFISEAGYSFLIIYILSESADNSELDDDYAAEQADDYQYDMLTIEMLKETAVCSDRECPCPETRIPDGTGYLYISPEAVTRMTALNEGRTAGSVGFGLMPVLVCEQGAKLRGLDLKVAAEDAERWWKTGKVSLRPTPMAKSTEVDTFVEETEQAEEEIESSPQPAGGKTDNPLGIEFKQEAYDLVARMEKLSAEKDKNAVFKAGDRVKIFMPLAGIPKPEETGLPHEVIMDEGHTGVIVRAAGDEMVAVRWDAGKYRIYKDLDLATMKYLDNGSLKSEGFESEIHTSYLEKIKEGKTAITGPDLPSGKSEQDSAPPQKRSSLKDLNHQAFYEEAETVEAAREKILQQIPDGNKILIAKITDANREYKLRVHGRNADKCQEMADKLLPANITVIKRNTLNQYRKFKKNVEAFTVYEAMQLAIKDEEFITVSSLVVKSKGKSSLFGLIKKNPDQYEAELEQDEIMEINYKAIHSAVYFRTGPKAAIPSSLTKYDDLPEVLWSYTKSLKGAHLSNFQFVEQLLLERLEKETVTEVIKKYDETAEALYLIELLRFTGEIYDSKMTYDDYEPVCFYLVDYYRNRLLPQIIKIKNGKRVVFEVPLYNTFGVDRLFGHYEKYQLDIIKPALVVSFKVFENFLSLRLWS